MDAAIRDDDPELLELIPRLLSIANDLMMDVYLKKKDHEDADLDKTYLLNDSQRKTVYAAIQDDMVKEWFGNSRVLTKEDFMTRLMKTADKYLMAHSLRILIRKKVAALNV